MIRLWDTAGTLLAAHEPLAPPVRIPDDMAWCRESRAERIEFRVHRASAAAEALIRAETDWDHIVAVDMPDGVFRGRVTHWSTARGHDTATIEVTEFASPPAEVVTVDDMAVARENALKMAGCSLDELKAQAAAGQFEGIGARLAWMVLRD